MSNVIRKSKWEVGGIGDINVTIVITTVNPGGSFTPCVAVVPGELHCRWIQGSEAVSPLKGFNKALKAWRHLAFRIFGSIMFINNHVEVTAQTFRGFRVDEKIRNGFSTE